MTPYNFVQQFRQRCEAYGFNPSDVWHHCDMDEHQTLIDELPGEWECLERCLKSWNSYGMYWWDRRHEIPLPEINCKTCKHFNSNNCGWFKKPIPDKFDKSKACQHWNEER